MDLQKEDQNSLYTVLKDYVPKDTMKHKNTLKAWRYGYSETYDMVVISKDGTVGEIINISGLIIALPGVPENIHSRDKKSTEQYWEREEYPKELKRIQSIFQWNTMAKQFKEAWVDYIE